MIITTLMGGLGNQMFQYAVGRTVSLRTGRRLVLDATLLPAPAGDWVRTYELSGLPIATDVLVLRRIGRGRNQPPSRAFFYLRRGLSVAFSRFMVIEPTGDIFMSLAEPPLPFSILFGYWQSPQYFVGFDSVIRRELMPQVALNGPVAPILRGLDGRDIIAVHVRRGDYVTDQVISRSHGTQRPDYYLRAAEILANSCNNPSFVVMSDNPAWAAAHLRFDAPTVHAELQAPMSAIEALALMSRARHAIIANSTLSWWGAWLAEHPDQMVVAPRRWFRGGDIDPAHRLPPAWRLI